LRNSRLKRRDRKSQIEIRKSTYHQMKSGRQMSAAIENPKSKTLRCYFHLLDFRVVVHEQIFLPFGTRLGLVTKQYVIETEPQKLLRRQQRHACLFGCAITFSLITFHTCGDE